MLKRFRGVGTYEKEVPGAEVSDLGIAGKIVFGAVALGQVTKVLPNNNNAADQKGQRGKANQRKNSNPRTRSWF